MAAVGAEVAGSWFLSGVAGFFILLVLLSIFLTALCSDCNKRSFELRESEADKNPSTLIRVVKLEEAMVARENPMINEIQNDEKDFNPGQENTVSFTPWRSHLGAPQNHQDAQTNGSAAVIKTASVSDTAGESNPKEETSVTFTPWRSHLREPPNQGLDLCFCDITTRTRTNHIYHTIGEGRSSSGGDADQSSLPTNQEQEEEHSAPSAVAGDLIDNKSVYARVSKKATPTTPPVYTHEEVQVEEEKESLPPLPDRMSLEG
ncbi:uncharacterized protein si:ch73-204p21.2 isoform X2 [Epinephelus moara]|uniref:uncharacterized protein si:ch73-204p21.2 isoform X2 n=1 Tax=Epinephelus moara TaxID=300413 RepID=UPI00214EF54C|nr:uncharacterized protein si:ch73-204p21.2 isoform X2 [Epinephelus moara]